MIADNLDDLYRNCNPDLPLPADDPRYVELSEVRGTKVIADLISRRIGRSDQGDFHQQLLTGHRGSGKSTELFRLKKTLEEKGFIVVYIDTEEQLDISDINYLDVLLCIAKELQVQLSEQDIELNDELLNSLTSWFADQVIEKTDSKEFLVGLKTEAGAKATVPFFTLLAKLTAEIKAGSSRKEQTRLKLEKEKAVFIDRLNILIFDARNKIQTSGKKDLVLIVDGLEKMPYRLMDDKQSTHSHLFIHNAEQLKAPECHIIYTVPISLAYNANLGSDFSNTEVIPMVKINDAGIIKLREVVSKRVNIQKLFDQPESLDQLIKLSGGVVRDLMHLLRACADTDNTKVSESEIQYAQNELVLAYDRLVRNDELENLRFVAKEKRVTGDESYSRLLNLRLVLEYQNGKRWAGIHPAVLRIAWVNERLKNDE